MQQETRFYQFCSKLPYLPKYKETPMSNYPLYKLQFPGNTGKENKPDPLILSTVIAVLPAMVLIPLTL